MAIRAFDGKSPDIAATAFVDPSALVIGDVTIGENSSVWPMTVIRADVQKITIGQGTNIQDACILHVTHDSHYTPGGYPLQIGNSVTVGHRATLHACKIGDYCLIGMSATIMDGAVLDNQVIVGAGSLVPAGKHLVSGYLYVGSPAKQVRALTETQLESLAYSAEHYIEVKNRYSLSKTGGN